MAQEKITGHARIETSNFLMIVLILIVVSFGLVEIVPLFFQKSTTQPVEGLKPYTALQLVGRDVYIREGCYNCHSQMIRPFRAEACATARTRWPVSSSTTTRSSGAASAPGPTWHAWAGATATNGTART
jgi:cbb3-type cytochrome oxidase cytochrome c subunit